MDVSDIFQDTLTVGVQLRCPPQPTCLHLVRRHAAHAVVPSISPSTSRTILQQRNSLTTSTSVPSAAQEQRTHRHGGLPQLRTHSGHHRSVSHRFDRAASTDRPRRFSTRASTPRASFAAFSAWNRAENLERLPRMASPDFDVGSQNWAYADADGNLAYFTSAENPLRKDLEDGHRRGAAALLHPRRLRARTIGCPTRPTDPGAGDPVRGAAVR